MLRPQERAPRDQKSDPQRPASLSTAPAQPDWSARSTAAPGAPTVPPPQHRILGLPVGPVMRIGMVSAIADARTRRQCLNVNRPCRPSTRPARPPSADLSASLTQPVPRAAHDPGARSKSPTAAPQSTSPPACAISRMFTFPGQSASGWCWQSVNPLGGCPLPIEIGVLHSQCLDRRIDSHERLVSEIAARERQCNSSRARIKEPAAEICTGR
jgi:hypothetical protein